MHIFRWCVGGILGLLTGFLSLSLLAAFAYALPRAVSNAARGFVRWNASRFYLCGALVYAGLLLVVAPIAHWLAVDLGGLLFGSFVAIIPMLSNLRKLQADVDERLGRALAVDLTCKDLPTWTIRWRK